MAKQSIVEYLQSLPIPWLVGRDNGRADVAAWGGMLDSQVATLKTAVKTRFPDYAVDADALEAIGGDRKLVKGPYDATIIPPQFAPRLKDAWGSWSRAGQPAEMLAQLHFGGFSNAVLVQQNGLAYTLNDIPQPGEDPTALLVVTAIASTIADMTLALAPQREGRTEYGPAGRLVTSKTIPSGNHWWVIDSDTTKCRRFEVLFPIGAGPFMTYAVAAFTSSATAAVTWNNNLRFTDTNYLTMVGPPFTVGTAPAYVWEDPSTRTTTGTTIKASSAFSGDVFVVAWVSGDNPFANLSASDLGRLRYLINTWRPARTVCAGVHVLVTGRYWGWPVATWGWGGNWGGTVVSFTADP